MDRIAAEHSHPAWLVRELVARFGVSDTQEICRANNVPPSLDVRVNSLRATRDVALGSLTGQGAEARSCKYSPHGLVIESSPMPLDELGAHKSGMVYVMDEAAMMVAPVLDPAAGSTVLDACAAPGGKTTHLAALMQNAGRIVAMDIHEARLHMVGQNCSRLGVKIVESKLLDARESGRRHPEAFDAALVDAPCSGLGVLRRRPDLRWRKQSVNIQSLVRLQAEILDAVSESLKPGGVLVYSTCSIHPDENQGSVSSFLTRHRDFHMDTLEGRLPDGLREGEKDGMLELWPHIHGTDGFFIARIRKDAM